MRVFVAGATGAVGSRLVPMLVAAGHRVVGMTRTPHKARLIRDACAEPAVARGLDAAAVHAAVVAAAPEVIVHEMTALGGLGGYRNFDRTFAATNRLRTEGLDILMAAARTAGARRIVVQSYCGWPYARTGGPVKQEDDPLDSHPPRRARRTLAAICHLERTVLEARDIIGTVLRYGAFYGPDTGLLEAAMLDQVRHRRVPLIGEANGWWSFLHVGDAAAATAAAVAHDAGGIFNITDDEPAPVHQWLPTLAALLGAARPRRIPRWLARLVAGDVITTMMTASRAGCSARARRELGWRPQHASWRQGFAEVIGA